jgi:thiamine-phosphate pyrophosphorylase
MKLHALVDDPDTARAAIHGGATVLQLRIKGASSEELVRIGRDFVLVAQSHNVPLIVNDDVEAAAALGADGVHLGQSDEGAERAREHGLLLGLSASDVGQAIAAERAGAAYVGAGPIWPTPSKPDADPAIGLDGLAGIADAVSIPVIAIGGIDATNAGACIAAGASGVAVIRAATDAAALREAIDGAFATR